MRLPKEKDTIIQMLKCEINIQKHGQTCLV